VPKPEIQILVCTNSREPGARKRSCGHHGATDLYRAFKDTVRELGLRDRVMVVRTGCLKHCSRGTTVTIWPHNFWYKHVKLDDIREIIETSLPERAEEIDRLAMPDIPWE